MKNKWISFLKLNRFLFGDQLVSQFVIFECKYLFSIIVFYFHKTSGQQDRYHTHAFNAISFKIFGQYTEFLYNEISNSFSSVRRTQFLKYFPKESFHKIGESNGCCTILLSGPWSGEWKELINGELKSFTWGRLPKPPKL